MGDSSSDFAALKLEDSPAPIPHMVGIFGTCCESGHANELGHSIAPIIEERHARLSFTTPVDPNVLDQETDSIKDSADRMSDIEYEVPSDSSDSEGEHLEDTIMFGNEDPDPRGVLADVFFEKLHAIIDESLKTNNLEDVVGRVNSLRVSYGMLNCRICKEVVGWMIKSALGTHHDSEEEFNKYIEKMFFDWKHPLKSIITRRSHERVIIWSLQFICEETPTAFYPFSKILTCLYENDLVSKIAVLFWAQNDGWEPFLNQSQKLIKELTEDPNYRVHPDTFYGRTSSQ